MPMARRKLDRVHQLARALRDKFPAALPVRLRVKRGPLESEDSRLIGYCARTRKGFFIALDSRLNKNELLEVLMHEWAHAITWRPGMLEDKRHRENKAHDDEFFLAFGRIWRWWHDQGGRIESGRY